MDNAIIQELAELRKALHRQPRLSGDEGDTAALIAGFISRYKPDEILAPIGGTGLAAVYNGTGEGPSTMIRCELDALPLVEAPGHDHVSEVHGIYHACGHDGHMAITAGLAPLVSGKRLARGRVVLLFQPAEETGTGARGIIEDAVFPKIRPDYIFALHNLPGFPLGHIALRSGTFACASLGMVITLRGKKAHASNPGQGKNPALTLSMLIAGLSALPGKISTAATDPNLMITVIFAELGQRAMGIAPGEAELRVTLRSSTDTGLEKLADAAVNLVAQTAESEQIEWDITWCDLFPATENHQDCVEIVRAAAIAQGLPVVDMTAPFRWSEDFGHYTHTIKGALFGIGAGTHVPGLHDPGYDFPDTLLRPGIAVFSEIIDRLNGLSA